MTQKERTERCRQTKGLVSYMLLVRPETKDAFAEIRQRELITAADLLDKLIKAYQQQTAPITHTSQAEPSTSDMHYAYIDLKMTNRDRRELALSLLRQHKGDKEKAAETLREMLRRQYPGFSIHRKKNKNGEFAEALAFYLAASDFLTRYLKKK